MQTTQINVNAFEQVGQFKEIINEYSKLILENSNLINLIYAKINLIKEQPQNIVMSADVEIANENSVIGMFLNLKMELIHNTAKLEDCLSALTQII